MDTAFTQPYCPAKYATSSTIPTIVPVDSALPRIRNDALVYLAIAVAGFAAVPTLFWLRQKRQKERERRRNRAMVENLKAKMEATRVPVSTATKAHDAAKAPVSAVAPVSPQPTPTDEAEVFDLDDGRDKKKRSKDRRKRGRERESSRPVRSQKRLATSRPSPAPETTHEPPAADSTPRAPEQPRLSNIPTEPRAPSPRPPSMPGIASPTPVSLISASFRAPSPASPHTRSDTSSQPGQSRSASASPTTAPLTPPLLTTSVSLPPLVSVKSQEPEVWVPQLSHMPRDDPAWDWDGQSSTYSVGSPSRAPSSSGSQLHQSGYKMQRSTSKSAVPRPMASSSPASPATSSMPSAPSLVFPSLNAHPPPGASLVTQIASLKGALEASRTREDKHRRDAERWSKECDLIKWRWNEAADMWRRREADLQAQMHHLVLQLQSFTHAMQSASLSPPIASFMPGPGQSPFPLAMPFPSHHGSPFGMNPATASSSPDTVNEDLAEAILKRPQHIRPPTASSSHSAARRGEERSGAAEDAEPQRQSKPTKQHEGEEIIEFEFPTLLERRVNLNPSRANSPRVDTSHDRETVAGADVEIFT